MTPTDALDRYAAFFETMTPASLDRLGEVFTPGATFRDPFNDVTGLPAIRRVFEHMYDGVERPTFRILHRAPGPEICYLKWAFSGVARGRSLDFIGIGEVRFDAAGFAVSHVDHWDAAGAIYGRVPVLGAILRLVRRRLSA
ncbi:MAG: nuclear transport factor 2 family protein, partial [Rhodospirillales bacterium]|nr:nuclear transport factor 2 family protein [Rhodospirillales bacterium]